MRIAVSGTHFMGKTTFIQDFIKIHSHYIHEIEPYFHLQEEQEIEESEEPTLEFFIKQLDHSIERLQILSNQSNVIFDRCPIDFVAYAMYVLDQTESDIHETIVSEKFPDIKVALENLDLIVFFPITKEHETGFSVDEDEVFRKAVDANLKEIYREDRFDLFPGYDHPKRIELWGNRRERMKKMETYL